jgi:hypothetical protein
MTLMAGREAETIILGRNNGGDGSDRYHIKGMIRRITPLIWSPDPDKLTQSDWTARLRERTRKLVRRHQATIEHMAFALLRERELTATQVDRLMRERAPGRKREKADVGAVPSRVLTDPIDVDRIRGKTL